jgi:hypothetical protein
MNTPKLTTTFEDAKAKQPAPAANPEALAQVEYLAAAEQRAAFAAQIEARRRYRKV